MAKKIEPKKRKGWQFLDVRSVKAKEAREVRRRDEHWIALGDGFFMRERLIHE
jgi:hypothetical protein